LTWFWFECVNQDFYFGDVDVSNHLSMNMWFCFGLDFLSIGWCVLINDCGHTKIQRQQPFDYKKETISEIELESKMNTSNNNYLKFKISTIEGSKKFYVINVGK